VIPEVKFINENKFVRVLLLKKKQPFQIDIDLYDASCTMKKVERFEDKSVFKFGLTYVHCHESLNKFIQFQQSKGNLLAFPEKDISHVIVLNREDKQNKFF